jgi:carbamoyltransferase
MLILGINAYHADAAACILRDGRLLAAAEEERFRRIKHWAGFPLRRRSTALVTLQAPPGVSVTSDP